MAMVRTKLVVIMPWWTGLFLRFIYGLTWLSYCAGFKPDTDRIAEWCAAKLKVHLKTRAID